MTLQSPELWGAADSYERYMGRWSQKVAPLFLTWLEPDPESTWLDVGCGTGVLSREIARMCRPTRLIGIDSSAAFLERAEVVVPEADFRQGDATAIDLPTATLDYVVSGLMLNFVSRPARAVSEMARVLRPGGTVALYVWDYAGHMQIVRVFFDAARQVDPGASAHDEGKRFTICRPKPLEELFVAAGFFDVRVEALDITASFDSFDDYWLPFLGGTGSAPKYLASLEDEVQHRLRDSVRERLPTGPDGEILLAARAWGVRGRIPT